MTCAPVVHVSNFYSLLAQCIALVLLLITLNHWLRHRGVNWLRGLIQDSEDHIHALEVEKELLAENQRQLDEEMKEQKALFEHLNKMVMQWSLAQEKKLEVLKQERQSREHALQINMKKREAMLAQTYLEQKAIPAACQQVRALFQEQFSSVDEGNRFLSALCDRIEPTV